MTTLKELLAENPDLLAELDAYAEEKAAGLKANRDKALETKASAQKELNVFNELGGLERFKELASKESEAKRLAEDAEKTRIEASGDVDQLKQSHTKQVSVLHDTITGLQQEMVNGKLTTEISKAISTHNGIGELLEPAVLNRVSGKMTENGIELQVKNADGSVMLNEDGTQANVGDLVKSLKSNEALAGAFKSNGNSGSGGVQSGDLGMTPGVILDPKDPNFNFTKAMEFSAKHPEQAKAGAEAAGIQVD